MGHHVRELEFDGDVDRRADQHQPPHLLREARGIEQRHPAALAETDQVERRPDLVDRDIEIGQIVVDGEIPHLRRSRAPVGEKDAIDAAALQRLDDAVAGREVGNQRTMLRVGRTDQRRRSAGPARKIAQAEGREVQRDAIGRGPGQAEASRCAAGSVSRSIHHRQAFIAIRVAASGHCKGSSGQETGEETGRETGDAAPGLFGFEGKSGFRATHRSMDCPAHGI